MVREISKKELINVWICSEKLRSIIRLGDIQGGTRVGVQRKMDIQGVQNKLILFWKDVNSGIRGQRVILHERRRKIKIGTKMD